ncbi:MAG: hypothetical protein JO032_15035 [Alphaproteobacteria bacterium]|nr:hypothetical protein [Alphaproteobacteria bacterium]
MFDFHLLLQEALPKLLRYATALTRDPDVAADLVEDTVREALAQQRRCPPGGLRVWLLTILHDLRGNPFRQLTLPAATPRDPRALLTLSDLDCAIGQLAEEQRAAILLIGLEGLSNSETAAVLRISGGTLRSRLARARERLRRTLAVAEPTPTPRAA